MANDFQTNCGKFLYYISWAVLTYYNRYEYTRSTKQFEIRMTTQLHEGLVGIFIEDFVLWRAELEKLDNPRISHATKTLRLHGHAHIEFSVPEGPMDMKSGGMRHICELECPDPALVFEVGFANTREESNQKAKDYSKLFSEDLVLCVQIMP